MSGKRFDDAKPSPDVGKPISRRTILSVTGLGLASMTFAGCTQDSKANPPDSFRASERLANSMQQTTLDVRIVLGDRVDPSKPYCRPALDSGQRIFLREELYGASPARSKTRKSILAFAHITDTHILDATSPGHMSMRSLAQETELDEVSAYYFRPQDSLTGQVMEAMIRKLNAIAFGPKTGRRIDCYVSTGDAGDNRGRNEVQAFIDIMDGTKTSVSPFTNLGASLQSSIDLPPSLSRLIWQPKPSKSANISTSWQAKLGYPLVPSLLRDAIRPIATEGANVRWYAGFGNHDQLAQDGIGAVDTRDADFYSELTVSNKLVLGLPKGMRYTDFTEAVSKASTQKIKNLISEMPGHPVRASPLRRRVSKSEFIKAHLSSMGRNGPPGHGFTQESLQNERAYYRFDLTDTTIGLMLDTTDSTGSVNANLESRQVKWLEEQLRSVSTTWYEDSGQVIKQDVRNKYVVVFSHHPSTTFAAPRRYEHDDGMVASPDGINNLLGRYPNVILWINGHMHRNTVWPRKSSRGDFGYWEINTASHIDYPQQARIVEVADNQDGSISVFGIMVDHSEPGGFDYDQNFSARQLASLSTELSMNYPLSSTQKRVGSDLDQNVELVLRKPF